MLHYGDVVVRCPCAEGKSAFRIGIRVEFKVKDALERNPARTAGLLPQSFDCHSRHRPSETYIGSMIMKNMSLYARETLGEAPEKYAGVQLAPPFGFKCVMGFGLGWLVTKLHARTSLIATTSICIAGIAWALFVPSKWYLLGFGLLGAGELFYVYYLNYIVSCSKLERMRENTVYTTLVTVTIGVMPIAIRLMSDRFDLRASFVAAIGILALALILVQLRLPEQPKVADEGSD